MNCYKNLYILGTSHISKDSVSQVEDFILNQRPDIVAIELDKKRFYALVQEQKKASFKDMLHLGVKALLINIIGAYVEKKLGKIVGVSPGSEMKMAIELVKKNKLKLSLIDQNIEITLKKLSKAITARVIFRFLGDAIKAIIFRKKDIELFDIKKVPSKKIIDNILIKIRERYPAIYEALIEERNEVMARNLYKLMNNYKDKKIFAVVGAGHESEIINVIKRTES